MGTPEVTEPLPLASRLSVARRFVGAFEDAPCVVGLAVGGSVALGLCDDLSDLDLAVIFQGHASVPAEIRTHAYSTIAPRGEVELDVLGSGTFDSLKVGAIRVEIEFHHVQTVRDSLTSLATPARDLWRRQPPYNHHGYATLSMVHHWRVLSDRTGALAQLVRDATLPPALRDQILQQGTFLRDPHLLHEHERACLRADTNYAVLCHAKLLDHFTQIAFAAANVVYPGDKCTQGFLCRLHLPRSIVEDLREFAGAANDTTAALKRNAELAMGLYRALVREVARISARPVRGAARDGGRQT